MSKKILIKNAKAVVTCNNEDQVLYDADILIKQNKIEDIGYGLSAHGAEVIDGKDKFVYPGLINTHHHFFQSFVRNLYKIRHSEMSLVEWLTEIYKIFQAIDLDVIYYASLTAMADLIKHGCTCAFDHQYCYTTSSGKYTIDKQFEAADLLGLRYIAGRGTNTLPKEKGSTMPEPMVETTDAYIKDCERLIDEYHDSAPFSMKQIVLAPCQPINCYPETFVETVSLARDKNVHMHTHLGEGENALMIERYGMRSVEWCQDIGFIGSDVWYAHGVELQHFEYEILGKAGTGVSHCPAPVALGGLSVLDIPAMQDAGVLISLGCDGSATNDGSSLLDSMRLAYCLQSYFRKDHKRSVLAYDVLRMATVNGAKTLGRSDIGSIEIGKAADMFMIDTGTLDMCGALHDPKNILAYTGYSGPVWLTMCNGKVIFKEGEFIDVDERRLAREGEDVCNRVLRSKFDVYSS